MPSLRNWDKRPTRRSERLSEPSRKSSERKRKHSQADEESEPEIKMLLKRSSDGRKIDSFCWICHKVGQEQICATCPRVYHNRCLKSSSSGFNPEGVCLECLSENVDGTESSAGLSKEYLQDLLICLMLKIFPISPQVFNIDCSTTRDENLNNKRILLPALSQWPQHVHEVCSPMDVEILIDFINSARYTSTSMFYGDVKWMYHNCYKIFGVDSDVTTAAKKLVKEMKNELLDMELCYECYYKKNCVDQDLAHSPFVTLCESPHRLLWVKLRGYSYWPSKCLKVINSMAHVQFFGTHDRTAVKTNTCFLMSKANPSGKKLQRAAYQNSVDEMNLYIRNYEKKYGPYVYAQPKTVFVPEDAECYVAKAKRQASCNLNTNASSELTNENSLVDESDQSGSQDIVILDDVQIAATLGNYTLHEDCELIEVSDEEEHETAVDNSANGQFQLHDVLSQVSLEQNSTYIQNPAVIDMSDLSFHIEVIPAPECPSDDNMQSLEIQPNLNSVSVNEPSNDSNSLANNENQEDSEDVCYLDEKQKKTSTLNFSRTDLDTLSIPTVKSLISEGEDYVHGAAAQFVQYTGHFGYGPKLVQNLLIEVMKLEIELQAKRDEIKKLEVKLTNTPDFTKFVSLISKRCKQKLEERIAAEKQNVLKKSNELYKSIRIQRKKYLDLQDAITSKNVNKKFVSQETQVDLESKDFLSAHLRLKREQRLLLWEQKKQEEILLAKSNTWCKKCRNSANLHCCFNANYCDESCQNADAARHLPICQNPRNLNIH